MYNLDEIIDTLKQFNIAVKNTDGTFRTFGEVIKDINEIYDELDMEERDKAIDATVKYGYKTLENI